jgi:two-component system LytT family response regulator
MPTTPLTAILVDDEPLAREELAELLIQAGNIGVIAEFGNAIDCLKQIHKLKADVLFVDIQMPQVSGLELINMLDEDDRPLVVFVTAYDQHAIQAFEDNAFDYLLKPVDPKRLAKTLDRIRQAKVQQLVQTIPEQPLTLVPCHYQNRVKLVQLKDIEYAYSDHCGVHIGTGQDEYHTQLTLRVLEQKTELMCCHRQYLVRPNAISEIELLENCSANLKTCSGKTLPVSRRYLKELKALFGLS